MSNNNFGGTIMGNKVELGTLLSRMNDFTRMHRKLNGMLLDYYKLTESSIVLFDILEDEEMTLKAITDASYLDKSTISRQVNSLVKKGYIDKKTGNDKRYSYFKLTEQAKTVYAAYKKESKRAFDDLLSGWTEEEKQKLSILLMRLNRIYESAI